MSDSGAVRRLSWSPRECPVTAALIALNVAAYIAAIVAGAGPWSGDPAILTRLGSNFGPLASDGERWRAFTSLFLHFGFWHLAINMVALAELGRAAERAFGRLRFVLVYVGAGVAASLASVAWNPWVNSAGASGAIFGLLGALLARSAASRRTLSPRTLAIVALYAAAFVAFSVLVEFAGTRVDHAAHLAGLVVGFAAGLVLGWNARRRATPLIAAVALVLASWFALAALQHSAGPAWRQENAFLADLAHFVDVENERAKAVQASHAAWRQGAITRRAHADAVRQHAIRLAEDRERLVGYRLDPSSPSETPRLQRVLDVALALRVDALNVQAAAVRTGDRELAEAAETALARSDALWRQEMCVKGRQGAGCGQEER